MTGRIGVPVPGARSATRVLVTGAGGLIGRRWASVLAAAGHEVSAIGRDECDLADRDAVRRWFLRLRPQVVHHAAAMTEVDRCEREPDAAFRDNVLATSNLA